MNVRFQRALLILILTQGLPAHGADSPSTLEVPLLGSSAKIGTSNLPPALRTVDEVAKRYGIDDRYRRSVDYVSGSPEYWSVVPTPPDGEYAVVSYGLPHEAPLAHGVQIWIVRKDGSWWVVPKSVLRAADQVVLRSGEDLTQFIRVPQRQGEEFRISYRPNNPHICDGEFHVRVDAQTGRAISRIYWWDGTVDRVSR